MVYSGCLYGSVVERLLSKQKVQSSNLCEGWHPWTHFSSVGRALDCNGCKYPQVVGSIPTSENNVYLYYLV